MIAAVEDALLARLAEAFQGRLRAIDHVPARLDEAELARVLSLAPAAYTAFLGFQRRERPDRTVDATWGVYLLAANASGERARRRGDATAIGGYEMALLATAALEGWRPPEAAGPVEVLSCENLFSPAFEKLGRTVYGLAIELPMELPEGVEDPRLGLFETFHADWDVPPHGNVAPPLPADAPDAADTVSLPQEEPA
jgi:phage gp37-like protein